jgi:hypothetical protein
LRFAASAVAGASSSSAVMAAAVEPLPMPETSDPRVADSLTRFDDDLHLGGRGEA